MSTYTDISYIEREFTSSNLISLSYTDLMSDLKDMIDGIYYNTYLNSKKDKDGEESNNEEIVISDDQKLVNSKIEKISSFNITAYAVIKRRNDEAHKTIKFDIDRHNYEHLKINGYYLDIPLDGGEDSDDPVDPSNTLTSLESVFFNNTQSLDIEIDDKFVQYDKFGRVITDDEGRPTYGSIKKGDYFYLYFVVGTINNPEGVTTEEFLSKRSGENAELYYKFIYNPAEENEEETKEENTDAQNEWVLVPDDLDEGPYDYDLYYISDSRWKDYVFLNTVTLTELESLPNNTLRCYDSITRVFISPLCPVSFTFQLRVTSTVKKTSKMYTFNYVPKTLNVTKPHLKRAIKMNNPDVSYALLRTNPKLTGNVKVVIDENSNIYVDTFKVSNALSQRKYRHIKVGSDSYYGSTLVKYFKDMPTTDFYNVESKCYSLFSTVQSYQDQFYDMYRYGVKTNDDNLYSENYALLAPLCIKRVIPDFFLIFRVDKDYTIYDEESMSNAEKIQYFLSKGVLIKSYDMRINSSLGTYVRNIYEHSKNEPGDMYVSYSTDNLNKFIGISLDKGVVSSIYESAYSDANIKSQVALNDFYTNGFERNHIVSRNIINFEFMFNDPDVEAFSLNTYFGLYVKVNEQDESFSCIGINDDGEYLFDSSVYTFDDIDLSSTKLNTLIYGLTTPEKFIRLNTGLKHNKILNDYVNKPYKNLLTTKVNKVDIKNFTSFITVNFNKRLEVGDHYRIIDTLNDIIYEVILCDIDNAIDLQYMDYNNLPGHNEHDLSDVITNYYNEFGVRFEIKRVAVYTHYRDYEKDNIDESNEILKTQIEQIYYAFRKLGDENITSYKYNDNSISFVSNVKGTLFERICAASGFDVTLKQYVYETNDEKDTISYFGYLPGHKIVLDLSTLDAVSHSVPLWKTKSYSYLYPIHFEIAGNRMADVYGFIDISQIGDSQNIYECEIKENDLNIFTTKTILYNTKEKDENGNIQRSIYNPLIINTFVNDDDLLDILMSEKEVKYVQSFNDLNKYILNVKNPLLKNNNISLYNSYPLNSGICSIFNLKDFDFNVLDNKSIIKSSEATEKIGSAGEYSKKSIFSTRPFNETEEEEITAIIEENEQIIYSTEKSNKFGDPFCYDDTTIVGSELVNYEFSEHDQILKYGENLYVIKHCTLEEYITLLKLRLLLFKNKSILIDGSYYIKTEDYDELLNMIGLNGFGKYAGIVLRPFVGTDSVAYDESYEYFNHLVNYKAKHLENPIDFVGVYSTERKFTIVIADEEYECYGWVGIGSFANSISVNDFDLSGELEQSDYENPEVLYEDPDVLNNICSKNPIVKENNTEENFIDYIDKFKKYNNDDSILVGNNRNINRTAYLKNMYKLNHSRFDISLTCPYVCKWKSIGTDARIENLRLMYDYSVLDNKKSYYVVSENEFNSYLGILYLQNKNEAIDPEFGKKYINRSLDDVLFIDKQHMGKYERNFILTGNGTIDDILYDSVSDENKFSIAYTQGIGTIEFISGGIKFRIKSNNTDILDFAKYNGYSVAFVSLPIKNIASDNPIELIIDETRCEIMLVWYCYTNSLEYGVKMRVNLTNDLDNNVEVLTGLIASKINYTKSLSDISYKPIITDYNSYKGALIEDTMGFSTVVNSNTHDSEFLENESDKKFTRKGQKLCNKKAYVYISNLGSDPGAYTKTNIAIITGKLFNDQPVIRNISETYPYYNEEGYLTPVNPYIWHKVKDAQYNFHEELSDTGVAMYTQNLGQIKDSLLYVDDIKCTPSSIRNLNDLKESLKSCGIIIKKATGNYDYTTVENLLSLSIIDPITYNPYTTYKRNIIDTNKLIKDTDESGHIVMHADYGDHNLNILNDEKKYVSSIVHSTYAEPVMKDMLSFYYSSSSHNGNFDVDNEESTYIKNGEDIENTFNISFDGSNIFIKDTNNIEQMWINKYTLNNNYCLVGTNKNIKSMLFPIDVIKNVSIMNDCNINTQFQKYTIVDNTYKTKNGGNPENYVSEEWTTIKGYASGVEIKTFINSKALSLNTDKIEITKWKNNEVISSEKCIKLNITSSLVDYILTRPSFYNIWKNINLKNDEYKVRYIKNCILKYININNKIKFELRRSKDRTNKIKCSNTYNEKDTVSYNNFKNELKFENEKYYMYVYVDELYTYYPKITIML